MKVRVYGFLWKFQRENGVNDFLAALSNDFPIDLATLRVGRERNENISRLLAVTQIDDVWAGVFLSIKNARRYFETEFGDGVFKVNTREIEENRNHVDVNLFVINPANGCGLYEHYHHSAKVTTFNQFCYAKYRAKQQLVGRFGDLKHSLYLNEKDYADIVSELSTVNHVEYEFTTLRPELRPFMPASGQVTRQTMKVFFDARHQDSGISNKIAGFIRQHKNDFERCSVEGKDSNGHKLTCRMDNPSVFQESDFDQMDIGFELSPSLLDETLRNSRGIQTLISLSKDPGVREFFRTSISEE